MHPSRNELEKKNGRFIGRCLNENANQAGNFSRDKYTHVTFCAPTSVKLNPESADYIRSKYYGASSLSSLSCCCPLRSLRYIIPRRFVFTLSWGMHRQRVSDGHDPYSTPRIFFRKFRRSNFSKFQIPSFSFSLVSLFGEEKERVDSIRLFYSSDWICFLSIELRKGKKIARDCKCIYNLFKNCSNLEQCDLSLFESEEDRWSVPSLEKSKRTNHLVSLIRLLFLPGFWHRSPSPSSPSPSRSCRPLASPFRASPFCPPSFLLSFSLTAAAGVVLNSSHSRCLFARFNWKVLHAAHNAANDPRTMCVYTRALSYPRPSLLVPRPAFRLASPRDALRSQRVIVTELSLIIFLL